MSATDPDDTPTRHGGQQPARPDDPTVPAFEVKKPTSPPPRPAPAPAPKAVAGAAANDPLFGKELGGCRIDKLLGRGAMGAVYKARQTKLDRDVAVKIIRPEMMQDQRMLMRFEVEARTVGRFNSANVVMVHDVGFELGVHYLVMEFVQGKNLRDHVRLLAGGRLPAGEALPLLRQAIKGLEEAQRLSIVHRDIKPDNLMLTDRGLLKIADFGIAKRLQEDFSMTLTSELVGTPLYMSPEQCQGEADVDFRSDMYSLGATFYYLLTGEPPIRASSVYELIQTKTKMASLCLWKALPGLDENNPLSRVIERMTALDRDDRYGSYEDLVNDLLLVEQGQTVHVPKPSGGAGKRRGKQKSGRGAALAAILLLLAAGGGGYAWYQSRPGSIPNGNSTAVDVGKRAAEQLKALRARLAENGPSASLRAEIGAVVTRPEQESDRNRLLADVEAGLALATALARVPRPTTLQLPFDDLRAHFAAVEAATKANGVDAAELAAWRSRTIAAARAEDALGPLAFATLTSTWAQWQTDRGQAGGDAARLSELAGRLDGIEAGRRLLVDLVPSMRETVQLGLPSEPLDDARRRLVTSDVAPVDTDVASVLQEVREQFMTRGPVEELRDRASNLQPTRTEQIAARGQLLNELEVARLAREQAMACKTSAYPESPVAPFDDVVEYWRSLDRALQSLRAVDASLPPWALQLRGELRAEPALQSAVVGTCATLFVRWQQRPRTDPAVVAELALVRAATARALELFPAAAAALEQAVPASALVAATAEVAVAGQRQQWFVDQERVSKLLLGVATLADWNGVAAQVAASTTTLRAAASAFASDAEVTAALQRLAMVEGRWTAAVLRLAEIDKRLAAGELKAAGDLARGAANSNEGRVEFAAAGEAVLACVTAFEGLEKTLAVEAAETSLASAREQARQSRCLPLGEQRIEAWLAAITRLRTAASGMVAIPGGRPKGAATATGSFFMAATECSRGEFAQFLTDLRAAVAGLTDAQQRFDAVAPRLPGIAMTPDRLRELLEREGRDERLPIDNIPWHAAAACAVWSGRALPTAEEWSLAAFGEGGKVEFPWGNGWSNDPQQRNPSNQKLVDVDAGGLSWRAAEGARLHHLAGNVAEWLAADAGARQASLAGGRYTDSDRSMREQAAGKLLESDKTDARRGFGFRTVLRPRTFPGLEWPR